MALFDIRKEITVLKRNEQYGIEVIKGKEKLTLNTNQKELFIDLCSFSLAIGMTLSKVLEVISFSPITKEYLAFYKEEQKITKVIDFKGLEILIRNLIAGGYDMELLKTTRNQINKTIEQMEKE